MAMYTRKVSRFSAARAALAGAAARRQGEPITACPHDPDGTQVERFLARYWIKGWNRGRRAGL